MTGLRLGSVELSSRLLLGTGKWPSHDVMREALQESQRKKSLEPLYEYYYRQKEKKGQGGEDEAAHAHALLRLLKQVQ